MDENKFQDLLQPPDEDRDDDDEDRDDDDDEDHDNHDIVGTQVGIVFA